MPNEMIDTDFEAYMRAKEQERKATRALSAAIDDMLKTGIRNDLLLSKLNHAMLEAHSKAKMLHEQLHRASGENSFNSTKAPLS